MLTQRGGKATLTWSVLPYMLGTSDVTLKYCKLKVSLYSSSSAAAADSKSRAIGKSQFDLAPIYKTSSLPIDAETELIGELRDSTGKIVGLVKVNIKVSITQDFAKEREEARAKQVSDLALWLQTKEHRSIKDIAGVFEFFKRSTDDKIEHREIVVMYRNVEKVLSIYLFLLLSFPLTIPSSLLCSALPVVNYYY